ncbi:nucleoside deaminase [Hyphomicrobiales bacterium]|jgi:tRNA(adenine34) deaminase|nr:nucleoside deaminase [Hyphomicrobiales bacterium]MDC3272691.1 nucleoside deaminase [Hyphomicrobiales bacterium]|tara:strand:- start:2007 stop:2492 length:486 start_codon:yes stop_codon:yes gene_type:complete
MSNSNQLINKINPMDIALSEARLAYNLDEVPIGAVILDKNKKIISIAHNLVRFNKDPLAHAEILAIREAAKFMGNERLIDCDIYVTLEPCSMCASAISHARIRRLYYAADDVKHGAVENGIRFFNSNNCFHKPEVYGGISAEASVSLLKNFFKNKRLSGDV